MSVDRRCFVIVGAGQAGAWVARTLRAEGFSGRIVMIGDEDHPPYERPPLSKSILSGTTSIAEAALLDPNKARIDRIELAVSESVVAIDAGRRTLLCASGRSVDYDILFLTMGSRARHLPLLAATSSDRVHYIRTLADALRLKATLGHCGTMAVIGGGWIGLEVAATARGQGIAVTVLEAAPRLCARSVPVQVSDYLTRLHQREGVDIRVGASIESIDVCADAVVIKSDTDIVRADQLVIGIGIVPVTDLAEAAGIQVENGIIVDEQCRTSDPYIFAAGDVTSHPCAQTGSYRRLESWSNAQNQAIVAAKAALGHDATYDDVPWAWSDQFDVNLQILGHPQCGISVVARGDEQSGPCCWLILDASGRAVGAVSANSPRELRAARKAIGGHQKLDPVKWADPICALADVPVISG